jgi:2-phosphosulfolactate phosphatase
MQIVIGSLLDGAKQAIGAVAIIDVFRAFTTAAMAFANGASRILMVGSVEEALSLRDSGLVQICMGEVGGRAPPGFHFGNSPFEISAVDFAGGVIAQRTSAGTQGIVAARGAEHLYAASLVTAQATAKALLSHNAQRRWRTIARWRVPSGLPHWLELLRFQLQSVRRRRWASAAA